MVDIAKPNTAPTFTGRDGKLTTTFNGGWGDDLYAVALQQDGKALLGGRSNGQFALARYNADGTLDSTFSGDGKLTTLLTTEMTSAYVAPQSDGKIVVASSYYNTFTLARYLANGDLDGTFGTNGTLTPSFSPADISDFAILANGKILTAGTLYGLQDDCAVTRYNADGTLDTSFGNNGTTRIDLGEHDSARQMLVQSDGKILISSTNGIFTPGNLVRLNSNGTLDTSFDGDGKLSLTSSEGTVGSTGGLALQSDGKILFAGYVNAPFGGPTMALIRYNADGSLDTTFNGTGTATVYPGFFQPRSAQGVALQQDGKILIIGQNTTFDHNNHIIVTRFLSDGTLDQAFGNRGQAHAIIPGNYFTANALGGLDLQVQADGKILVYGDDASGSGDFVLIRFDANGNLDSSFSPPSNTLDGHPLFSEPDILAMPVILDSDVVIVDAELAAAGSYNGASLTLERHGGASADDVFSSYFGGTVSNLKAGSDLSVDNVKIGSVTTNAGGTLTLTFGANATQSLVNKTMQQIAYVNKSDAPPYQVQIDWTFSDGNTGAQGTGGTLKTTGSTTVSIFPRNDAPLLNHALSNQNVVTDKAFSYVIPADSFVDPDHDALTYTIAMSDGSAVPTWLVFNAATRTLSGTPDKLNIGTYAIRVTASDSGGLWESGVFNVTVESSTKYLFGTTGADKLIGEWSDDVLQGFAGDDTLDGKGGADTLTGGVGNDAYYVDNKGDVVNEAANGGTDIVYSTLASYQLAPNVEYARALAEGQGNLTGNELGNVLYAGNGNNVLDGGLGNDTASYAYAVAGITVSLATTAVQLTKGSGTDTLLNIENLAGSRFNDTLTGNQGNNTLNGGAGADTMTGGDGSDTYFVDSAGDVVRETNGDAVQGGIDTVNASVSYKLTGYAENVTLTGTDAINATGNSLANKLVGNSGNNVLDGGAGADVMSGGLGNDTYYVDNAGDVVADLPNGGTDTVISTVTRTLGDNQENLTLAGTAAINGAGNSLDNIITGNSARNVLTGGGGADKMYGGLGDDFYYVDNAGDTVVESSDATLGGTDTVNSTISYTLGNYVENLTLSGTAAVNGTGNSLANKIVGNGAANVLSGGDGADTLVGGSGSDTLVGGQGKDVLEGGSGSDVYVFNAATETGTTSAGWDVVNDFVRGQDKIDLRGIDANTATVADDAFSAFIASNAAFTAAGQLKLVGGVLYGNTDADADAEFAVQLTGITQLTTADVSL